MPTGYVADPSVAVIRNSDRTLFKRCRRKWVFASHLRMGLEPKSKAMPLWFGTGGHFAMEDLHGERIYASAKEAFQAYAVASALSGEAPERYEVVEAIELANNILDYYEHTWLPTHPTLETYVFEGVPQIEVKFEIQIPLPPEVFEGTPYKSAVYVGTFDRVVLDEYERISLLDYKFVASIKAEHLELDPQISAYMWAGNTLYGQPISQFFYQQHWKEPLKTPEQLILKSGQVTTRSDLVCPHGVYRRALIEVYGSVENAPKKQRDLYEKLVLADDEYGDRWIKRFVADRTPTAQESFGTILLSEAQEMLNPNLPIYPNGTRDCSWDCPFIDACIAMDDGGDWQGLLEDLTVKAQSREEEDRWRQYLPKPQELQQELHRLRLLPQERLQLSEAL